MFSKLIKILFVTTAYAPILFVWGLVSIYNIFITGGRVQIIDFRNYKILDLFNSTNLIFIFFLLVISCMYISFLAQTKLTRNSIRIKSIKSADFNMAALICSYFLPCIEMYNKDIILRIVWIVILILTILIDKGTYFYNPLMKSFGFKYYEVSTNNGMTYWMISKKKLINKNDIKAYSKLTDYVILNVSK